jgi:hypothetical protein
MELVRRDDFRGTEEGVKDEVRLRVVEQVIGWLWNEIGKLATRGNAGYVPLIYSINQPSKYQIFE